MFSDYYKSTTSSVFISLALINLFFCLILTMSSSGFLTFFQSFDSASAESVASDLAKEIDLMQYVFPANVFLISIFLWPFLLIKGLWRLWTSDDVSSDGQFFVTLLSIIVPINAAYYFIKFNLVAYSAYTN